jgi:hypothetical protein
MSPPIITVSTVFVEGIADAARHGLARRVQERSELAELFNRERQ